MGRKEITSPDKTHVNWKYKNATHLKLIYFLENHLLCHQGLDGLHSKIRPWFWYKNPFNQC